MSTISFSIEFSDPYLVVVVDISMICIGIGNLCLRTTRSSPGVPCRKVCRWISGGLRGGLTDLESLKNKDEE